MKKIIALALVLVMALSLASCFGSKGIVGKWAATIEEEGVSLDMTMEFKKDGTCAMGIMGMTMNGKYTVSGDKIVMTLEFMGETEETEFTYELKGSELHLTTDGETQVFKKTK